MTRAGDAQHKTEAYLGRLRQLLCDMNAEDAREIVEELRSHITEKAAESGQVTAAGVDTALARLGSPEELASQYTTDALLARAEVSRSPVRILESLFRLGQFEYCRFSCAAELHRGVFPRGHFHVVRYVENRSPANRGIVGLPEWRRH